MDSQDTEPAPVTRDLSVPIQQITVDVLQSSGQLVRGDIFLPSVAQRHEGGMRPDEWLNQPSLFFPFRESGTTSTVLLNKAQIVAVTVPMDVEERPIPIHLERTISVTVDCGGSRFAGLVRVDMPATNSRVLDYLNRPGTFLEVVDGERCHLVQKTFITKVLESERV